MQVGCAIYVAIQLTAPHTEMSKAAESSNDDEYDVNENEISAFTGWLIYRLDSALAVRTNQFKLLIVVLLFTNAGKSRRESFTLRH